MVWGVSRCAKFALISRASEHLFSTQTRYNAYSYEARIRDSS